MSEADTWIVGQHVVVQGAVRPLAIRVREGRIAELADPSSVPPGAPVIDAQDSWILPGLVDSHVHINDPGRETWEGFDTATRAAASGGVTTLLDMPLNSIPATTTLAGLQAKVRALGDRACVDVALAGGLVPGFGDDLPAMLKEGVPAVKCFLAESGVAEFSHIDRDELERGMKLLAKHGTTLLVHAELPGPLTQAEADLAGLDPRAYSTYLKSRPKTAEDAAVEMLVELCQRTQCQVHVVHLSSAQALPTVQRARDMGLPFTVETCPHYLTFVAEEIPDGATEYKCAPPIRERQNQDALWRALAEGLISQVVTDHSPATVDLKCSGSGDFMKAWGGISSLQLGLSAVWTQAHARGLTLPQVVSWMCEAPAKLLGLAGQRGTIAVGARADLVFFDPDAPFFVDREQLHHKNKLTPYHARTLRGRVRRTFLAGHTVFHDGELATPQGTWLQHTR
jgi:allantoinase